MSQLTRLPRWIKATIDQREPFWVRPHRLFSTASRPQQAAIFRALRQDKVVYVEDENMIVEVSPMTAGDKQRLLSAKSFATGGFQLDSFRSDSAVFYNQQQYAFSMLERITAGRRVNPSVALDSRNTPVFDSAGQLLDLFVPLHLANAHFYPPPMPTPDEEDDQPPF